MFLCLLVAFSFLGGTLCSYLILSALHRGLVYCFGHCTGLSDVCGDSSAVMILLCLLVAFSFLGGTLYSYFNLSALHCPQFTKVKAERGTKSVKCSLYSSK